MKEKTWLLASAILGTLLLVSFLAIWQGGKVNQSSSITSTTSQSKPVPVTGLTAAPEPFNWGNIKINGGIVQAKFTLKNTSPRALKIAKLETSCMCTEASLKIGDQESPFFGMPGHAGNADWQAEIAPGAEASLTVKFDPAAHGPEGLGKVDRIARIWFSDPANSYRDIAFTATVVKCESYFFF